MENSNIMKVTNTKYNIKNSPHYEEQIEEIELLKNIIPDRLTILSEEPNYILEIIIKSSVENPEKEYRLKIILNYFYPEKPPRFEFYEINDFLPEKHKKEAISELNKIIEENIGMGILFQLYECASDFADKEEERRAKILKEYEQQQKISKFNISQMKKYKQIDNYTVTDILTLKNNYLVLACCTNKYNPCLIIYDEFYENAIYEESLIGENLSKQKKYQYTIKKLVLYNTSNTEDDLYIVCSDKNIRNYKINYFSKVIKKTGLNMTLDFYSMNILGNTLDMAILNDYKNYFLFVFTKEIIFWKYNSDFMVNFNDDKSIISKIECKNTFGEVFIFSKDLFILIGYKSSIYFLYINNENLKSLRWGKEIKIKCSQEKNYISKLDNKNILFWNNNLNYIKNIYIPTEEIVSEYEFPGISSICHINNYTYVCSKEGLEEVELYNSFLTNGESNNKYKFITLIKPINKGYVCFVTSSTIFICK